jgi:hypothetical protein
MALQSNESHHNRTAGTKDGGGFDLDGGVTESIIQYNRSHDNDGAGYLLAQFPGARSFCRNVVRYNLSRDDGRKNSYAGIEFWGKTLSDIEVHNNTVMISRPSTGQPAAVAFVAGETMTRNLHIRNNLLQVEGGLELLHVPEHQPGLLLQGNGYHASSSAILINFESRNYRDLASWRSATAQERIGGRDVGLALGPKGQVGWPLVKLDRDSPLIDAGLDLKELFGVDPGSRDLDGTTLPQGNAFDIGAIEYRVHTGRLATRSSAADDLDDGATLAHPPLVSSGPNQ